MSDKPSPRWTLQRVLGVKRWTDKLLSFEISRDEAFQFKPGHYARLGLTPVGAEDEPDRIVWRPMSIVSAPASDRLEFFAVLVSGGEFSRLLAQVEQGSPIFVDRSAFGFMTLDQLAPGRDLWLIASGTGLGPYISILRDPAVWSLFEHIYLVHSVRYIDELAYRDEIVDWAQKPGLPGRAVLHYLPIVTREPYQSLPSLRVPQLFESGQLAEAAGAEIGLEYSRFMVCGNPGLTSDLRRLLAERGFQPGRRGNRGQVAFEHYWTA